MSTGTMTRIPRAAFALACATVLVAGTIGTAVPAFAASPTPAGSVLAPIGEITPKALGPGVPSTNRHAFAPPFRTLDPSALEAAKLHAAAPNVYMTNLAQSQAGVSTTSTAPG